MKKRYFAILLVIILLFSACGGGSNMAYSEAPASSAADGATTDASEDAQAGAEAPAREYPPDRSIVDSLAEPADEEADDSYSGESYLVIDENTAKLVENESVLTFSLKVDTAAYTNVARYIESGSLPPRDAVRTEELINYFNYDSRMRFTGDSPFAIYTEVGASPFDSAKHLAFVRVKTQELDKKALPSSNLTFLIDTSGSMNSHDKLPLLKQSLYLLVDTLDEDDTVSIATYAGSSEVLLDSVNGGDKETIRSAIESLSAGGSTAGGAGIVTAYTLAEKNFMAGGNNRVILASDGDFNVGITDLDELKALISEKKDNGVYLSVLGFGTGNIRDDIMETLSAHGNGNYSYINNISTARKVLVEELASTLFTVADDVKAQVEFNPATVKSYRLLGYENRRMDNRDFDDDTKDAGEIGVGTDVVILFELEMNDGTGSNGLKYASTPQQNEDTPYSDELFEVRIRYKDPGQSQSKLVLSPVSVENITAKTSNDFNFASSVAAFADMLRGSSYARDITLEEVIRLTEDSLGSDPGGYRGKHLDLLKDYQRIA